MSILSREYYKHVYELYEKCGITCFPIDCKDIVLKCGFRLIPYSDIRKTGESNYITFMHYSSDAFQDREQKIIFYNDKQNERRIRFSLMHEISHFLLGHSSDSIIEDSEADCLASMILAPRIMIHSMKSDYRITSDFIYMNFGLSNEASNNAISDYYEWLREISCLHIRKPNEYELMIKMLFLKEKSA